MIRATKRFFNMGLGDEYVKKVFDTVAPKYDVMNDIMSLGIHRCWKQKFVERFVVPKPGMKFLDVAGGTGDIAFKICDSIRASSNYHGLVPQPSSDTKVTVCDINQCMLDEGQKRAEREGYFDLDWVCANAEELPFADESFDSYTVAFGIRNFSDRPKALKEANRVLKVGGVLNVLEFSKVTSSLFRVPYDIWSYGFIPLAGKFVIDQESYKYLVDSIRAFPSQEEFAKMIKEAGFSYVRYHNLTRGIACIHTGVKTESSAPNVAKEDEAEGQ